MTKEPNTYFTVLFGGRWNPKVDLQGESANGLEWHRVRSCNWVRVGAAADGMCFAKVGNCMIRIVPLTSLI